MDEELRQIILQKLKGPGWTSIRGVMKDPRADLADEEGHRLEEEMNAMAREGLVTLWWLNIKNQEQGMLAVALPDFDLGAELEKRRAWATAERIQSDA
jgi:hypothetical protein